MLVIHIGTECYPAVKNGGLADVMGSLPKYLAKNNIDCKVIIPFVDNAFTKSSHHLKSVFQGTLSSNSKEIDFNIIQYNELNLDLYLVQIPELFDRSNIYGYPDDNYRFLIFQLAVLEWLKNWNSKIDIIHCHNYNTGLIPFFKKHCSQFSKLKDILTIFTIHNTHYQGVMSLKKINFFPDFTPHNMNLLVWKGNINCMAAGIRCADKITTVSKNYMNQLCLHSHGLEYLFQTNRYKCIGILNGIDEALWDPETDDKIVKKYSINRVDQGKSANKKHLCSLFGLDDKKPLIIFVGKLTADKGADVLQSVIDKSLKKQLPFNFLIMGKGNNKITYQIEHFQNLHPQRVGFIPYFNDNLVHLLFASSDFLLMPSREEPCGLEQLYALKYGSIPIVSNVGGLEDTVIDFEKNNSGYGIKFSYFSVDDIMFSLLKADKIYSDKELLNTLRKRMMACDFSWTNQTLQYINLYQELFNNRMNISYKIIE